MKVALVSHSSAIAGAENVLLNLATHFVGMEKVEIYLFGYGNGGLEQQAELNGVRYISVENIIPWYLFVKDEKSSISMHWNAVSKSTKELKGLFLKHGIECVVINTLTSLPGIIAANELNLPSILWIHGIIDHMLIPESGSQFKMACDRILINSATSVFCPTHWIEQHYHYYRDDISIIPNFTHVPKEMTPYPKDSDKVMFACFNTWNSLKGVDCLIEATAILKEQNTNFVLEFYGSGEDEEKMRKQIETKGLHDVVKLKGRVNDVGEVYKNTSALVTASVIESFGMTLIESMAHGRPIIVSNSGGHLEVLGNGDFGLYGETGNPESFATQMLWVINNRESAEEMGKKAYLKAREVYDGGLSGELFIDLLKKSLNDRNLKRKIYTDLLSSLLKSFEIKSEEELIIHKIEQIEYKQIGNPLVPIKLKSKRYYDISYTHEALKEIMFLVGTHGTRVSGKIKLEIIVNNNILRESVVPLDEVQDNTWISFKFEEIKNILNCEIVLVVSVESANSISIYESFNSLSLLNKFKSRFPSQGMICCKIC